MPDNPSNAKISTPPKLLDRLRAKPRLLHYSIRTEEAYVGWCTKFILFHNKRHPNEMGGAEIERYLTYLAAERKVAASTQNQLDRMIGTSLRICVRKLPTDVRP